MFWFLGGLFGVPSFLTIVFLCLTKSKQDAIIEVMSNLCSGDLSAEKRTCMRRSASENDVV